MNKKYLLSYLVTSYIEIPSMDAIRKESEEIQCSISETFEPTEKGIRKFNNSLSCREGLYIIEVELLSFSPIEG